MRNAHRRIPSNIFSRLPALRQPSPTFSVDPPKRYLALIPVFSDVYYGSAMNTLGYLCAAVYSRDTCLRHSDAIDAGVSVKLYIEEVLRDERVEGMLRANFVDPDKDVIWFTAEPFEETTDGHWSKLAKKICPYFDEQLKDYELLMGWDADLFFLPASHTLFAEILTQETDKAGYFKALHAAWFWRSKLERGIDGCGFTLEELLEYASVPKFKASVLNVTTCLWTYPASHYHKQSPAMIDWLKRYAGLFSDDEVIVMLLSEMFDLQVFSMRQEYDLQLASMKHFTESDTYRYPMVHGAPSAEQNFLKLVGIL